MVILKRSHCLKRALRTAMPNFQAWFYGMIACHTLCTIHQVSLTQLSWELLVEQIFRNMDAPTIDKTMKTGELSRSFIFRIYCCNGILMMYTHAHRIKLCDISWKRGVGIEGLHSIWGVWVFAICNSQNGIQTPFRKWYRPQRNLVLKNN